MHPTNESKGEIMWGAGEPWAPVQETNMGRGSPTGQSNTNPTKKSCGATRSVETKEEQPPQKRGNRDEAKLEMQGGAGANISQ